MSTAPLCPQEAAPALQFLGTHTRHVRALPPVAARAEFLSSRYKSPGPGDRSAARPLLPSAPRHSARVPRGPTAARGMEQGTGRGSPRPLLIDSPVSICVHLCPSVFLGKPWDLVRAAPGALSSASRAELRSGWEPRLRGASKASKAGTGELLLFSCSGYCGSLFL